MAKSGGSSGSKPTQDPSAGSKPTGPAGSRPTTTKPGNPPAR